MNSPDKAINNLVTTRIANSKQDVESIAKLRYKVYIEEQGKPYIEADHMNKSFSDPLDQEATLVMIEKRGEIEGTVRLNYLSSSLAYTQYYDLFELHQFSEMALNTMGVCSRLAVSATCRNGVVREALFNAIYEEGYTGGGCVCFVACAPILLRLFKAYGFREYTTPFNDPTVGSLRRMLLDVEDIAHLKAVNSPFYEIALRLGIKPKENPILDQIFSDFRSKNAALRPA